MTANQDIRAFEQSGGGWSVRGDLDFNMSIVPEFRFIMGVRGRTCLSRIGRWRGRGLRRQQRVGSVVLYHGDLPSAIRGKRMNWMEISLHQNNSARFASPSIWVRERILRASKVRYPDFTIIIEAQPRRNLFRLVSLACREVALRGTSPRKN